MIIPVPQSNNFHIPARSHRDSYHTRSIEVYNFTASLAQDLNIMTKYGSQSHVHFGFIELVQNLKCQVIQRLNRMMLKFDHLFNHSSPLKLIQNLVFLFLIALCVEHLLQCHQHSIQQLAIIIQTQVKDDGFSNVSLNHVQNIIMVTFPCRIFQYPSSLNIQISNTSFLT